MHGQTSQRRVGKSPVWRDQADTTGQDTTITTQVVEALQIHAIEVMKYTPLLDDENVLAKPR
jgi:hypothetical protein